MEAERRQVTVLFTDVVGLPRCSASRAIRLPRHCGDPHSSFPRLRNLLPPCKLWSINHDWGE
jgi:hypothetical protein